MTIISVANLIQIWRACPRRIPCSVCKGRGSGVAVRVGLVWGRLVGSRQEGAWPPELCLPPSLVARPQAPWLACVSGQAWRPWRPRELRVQRGSLALYRRRGAKPSLARPIEQGPANRGSGARSFVCEYSEFKEDRRRSGFCQKNRRRSKWFQK